MMKIPVWRVLLVLAFLLIALMLPIITFDHGTYPYYPPPPGWSRYWTYYLAADYDYFWRYRISPLTLPLWLLVGIIVLLILTHSLSTKWLDLVSISAISLYTIFAWMIFVQYNFIEIRSEYAMSYLAVYAAPLIPIVGSIFVSAARILEYIYDREKPA